MDSVNIFTCMGFDEPLARSTGMERPPIVALTTSLSQIFKVTSV